MQINLATSTYRNIRNEAGNMSYRAIAINTKHFPAQFLCYQSTMSTIPRLPIKIDEPRALRICQIRHQLISVPINNSSSIFPAIFHPHLPRPTRMNQGKREVRNKDHEEKFSFFAQK
jgi:hypothetical protein